MAGMKICDIAQMKQLRIPKHESLVKADFRITFMKKDSNWDQDFRLDACGKCFLQVLSYWGNGGFTEMVTIERVNK